MIFILLAWLVPFILILTLVFTIIEDEDMTVGDFLELSGLSLIPILNYLLLWMVIKEIFQNSEKIQEFLKKKLK